MSKPSAAGLVAPPAPASPSTSPSGLADSLALGTPAASSAAQAWHVLRRNPVFWGSAAVIVLLVVVAVMPGWFTGKDPNLCLLSASRRPPHAGAWMGNDLQGCDVYARLVYGTRASLAVGALASAFTFVAGVFVGVLAGFYRGWVDAVLSRVTDVFFAVPFLLGAILIMVSMAPDPDEPVWRSIALVAATMAVLGWAPCARVCRSAVIAVRDVDYVQAARGLGAGSGRVLRVHILPSVITPALVLTTLMVGSFIAAEATLSFLGLGLRGSVITWGKSLAQAQDYAEISPHMVIFPSVVLVVAVLAFVLAAQALRDAFDPKAR